MRDGEIVTGYITLDVRKLRQVMDGLSMHQTALAARANLSRARLSALLRKPSARVHVGTERRIAAALGLPPGALDKDSTETAYRAALAEQHGYLGLTGLGIVEAGNPLPLDRAFLPPTLCKRRSEDDSNGPDGPGTRHRRSGVRRDLPRFSMGHVLAHSQRFFLLGDPGAGKTTALRYLARIYASTEKCDPPYPKEPWVPIFVRLADWAEQLRTDKSVDAVDSAVALLTPVDAAETSKWLRSKLDAGEALVLLDGLDEIPDPDLRALLIDKLRSFVQTYHKAHVVITSRIVGFDGPRLGVSFDESVIQPLTEEAVARFVVEWSAFRHGHKSTRECAECSGGRERLRRAITGNRRIGALASNPMMLTILCLLHEAGAALPQRRCRLYEKIAEAFLFSWEEKKRTAASAAADRALALDDREVLWLLESVAMEMQRRDWTIAPRWWLSDHCGAFLERELGYARDRARAAADTLLWSLQKRAGLLVERGPDRYGFRHLAFQEYFASRAVVAADDPVQSLQPFVYHPRWREVVRLVAAQLDRHRAPRLLRTILDDPDPTGRFLHRGLLIALECLADGAPVHDDNLLDQIKRSVLDLGKSKCGTLGLDVTAALNEMRGSRLEDFARDIAKGVLRKWTESPGLPEDVSLAVVFSLACLSGAQNGSEKDDNDREESPTGPVRESMLKNAPVRVLTGPPGGAYGPNWSKGILGQLTRDKRPEVRAFCAELLGEVTRRDPRVRRGLIEALDREEDSTVREAVVDALEPAAGRAKVRRTLLETLDRDTDSDVRGSCARALAGAAVRNADVRGKLVALLTSQEPAPVREGAAHGLARCVSTHADVRDLMGTILKHTNEDDGVRVACLRSLEDLLPSLDSGVELLEGFLTESGDTELAGVAALVLAESAATGRVKWGRLPIEKIEQVLVSLKNPCSHALDALRALVDARELRRLGIPREARIARALSYLADRIRLSFVFGSSARGDQGPDSDIDLMVVGDVSLKDLTPGLKRAEQELGRQVNVVVYSQEEWSRRRLGGDPFVMEVLGAEKRVVMGGQDELTAMA